MLVWFLNLATIGNSEPHETNRAYCSNRLFGKPMRGFPSPQGLYDPRHEHDNCGVGFICHIKGQASHKIVSDALLMVENMNHRGGCGCEPDSGDGAGIMTLTPDKLFRREAARLGFS